MQTIIIVAMTPDGLIGRSGGLPWHIPADLRHFKQTTTGHAVLMGRKTFDSISRPLPRRRNIVITRDPSAFAATHQTSAAGPSTDDPRMMTALDAVTSLTAGLDLCRDRGEQKAFIAGGAEIYAQALNLADELIVTWVRQSGLSGDRYFPRWTPADWSASPLPNADGLDLVHYRRSRSSP